MVATPGSIAMRARQPCERRVGGRARSILEAYRAGVAEVVEIAQKLADGLLASTRLVAPGYVGDLNVLDQRPMLLERSARIAPHHPDVVLVELQAHIGPIDRADQVGGAFGSVGEVARHIHGIDVLDQDPDPGRLGQWRRATQVLDGGGFSRRANHIRREHAGDRVQSDRAKTPGGHERVADALEELVLAAWQTEESTLARVPVAG